MKKILGILILMIICIINLTADLNEGLVAYYPFNGDANDESGNENNGTVNGATLTTDRFGNENSAYSFDGFDDFVEILHSSDLEFTDKISFGIWYKLSENSPSHTTLLSKTENSGFSIKNNYNQLPDDQINGYVHLGNDYISTSTEFSCHNMWHQVFFTFENDTLKCYLDGELKSSALGYGFITNNSNIPLLIGAEPNSVGANQYFDGLLDDVRIYNRNLSEDEIEQLYHEGGYPTLETGLIAHYPFNGNAVDESNHNNDGTVNGATLITDRFGNENSAFDFDGNDDYINISPIINSISSNSEGTISIWTKFQQQSGSKRIISFSDSGDIQSFMDLYTTSDGKIVFAIFENNSPTLYFFTNSSNFDNNEWHNIVVKVNSLGNYLYIDGNIITDLLYHTGSTTTQSWLNTINDLDSSSIGRRDWNSNFLNFEGQIDDIRIYNRYLSESEIREIYHQGNWPFLAKFAAEPCFGSLPLVVNFTDVSDNSTSWEWDFQNNGIIDSYEQNPVFTYTQSGMYDVKLKATFGTIVDSLIKTNYIVVQETQLQAPQNPIISKNGNDIVLNWDSVENADYYLIYKSDDSNNDFEYLDYTTAVTSYNHSDVILQKNKQFYIIIGFDGSIERLTEFIEQNQRKSVNVDFK